jgi:rhodanese-related sulfurtransferase
MRMGGQMFNGGRESIKGVFAIALCGSLLGTAYNWFGLIADKPWGLPWIGEDRLTAFEETELVTFEEEQGGEDYWTDIDDPLAVPAALSNDGDLPEIPEAGRPVQIELQALKQYFDANAAMIIDARDAEDYADAHIEGALNIPYEKALSDPAGLAAIDTSGRPLITYCGGGSCEVSLSVAEELFFAGHKRVAVYIGGFSEWAEAGYPIGGRDEKCGS